MFPSSKLQNRPTLQRFIVKDSLTKIPVSLKNKDNGQNRVAIMALFQSGFSGLALTAFIQYQSSTIPEIINADAI